jgi:hypothetical protein
LPLKQDTDAYVLALLVHAVEVRTAIAGIDARAACPKTADRIGFFPAAVVGACAFGKAAVVIADFRAAFDARVLAILAGKVAAF